MPLSVVLVGRMAALMKDLIESRLECEYQLKVIANLAAMASNAPIVDEADVIVGWPLSRDVARARNVKLIQASGAGIDGLPLELLPSGVTVANTFHHEVAIAEHVLMAMLFLARKPVEYDRRLRQGDWWDSCIWGRLPNLEVVHGKTALLIGTGHIAREVAKRARAFGIRTVSVSRDPSSASPEFDLTVGYADWRGQLGEADFIVPCCPLTPETEGLISEPEFGLMKASAYVINTARGKVIEEQALYEALRDSKIAGAAIDVWYDYPASESERKLPSKYPFHELPNVLMTPHVSAWTNRTIEGRSRDIAENINRLARGEALINVVFPLQKTIGERLLIQ